MFNNTTQLKSSKHTNKKNILRNKINTRPLKMNQWLPVYLQTAFPLNTPTQLHSLHTATTLMVNQAQFTSGRNIFAQHHRKKKATVNLPPDNRELAVYSAVETT
jgi:hypothetical protein